MTVLKSPKANRKLQDLYAKLDNLRAQRKSVSQKLSEGGPKEFTYASELRKTDEAIENAKAQCAELLNANGKSYLVAAL